MAYTFSTPIAEAYRENLEKTTSKEFADNFYTGWDAIELVFAVKGVSDLLKTDMSDIAKSVATKEVLGDNEFYDVLEKSIKNDKPNLSDAEINETIDSAREAMDQIKSEFLQDILEDEIANARRLLDDADE